MSEKSLALTEQALRLALAVLALGLASRLSADPGALQHEAGPKPGIVMEW